MTITLTEDFCKRGPRRFGVNVEVQDHVDRSNMWDFLADLGATCVRTFHPEQSTRREPPQPGGLGAIDTWEDFTAFRQKVVDNPQRGPIRWHTFRFDQVIPWMGIPDQFLKKYQQLGIDALVSIGTGPGDFPISLLPDLEADTVPAMDTWNAEAAAVLYEYAFAVIYHCAKNHGVRVFMTVNEPEWAPRFFHVTEKFKNIPKVPLIRESQPGHQPTVEGDTYRRSFAIQFAALAQILRLAIDDVQAILDVKLLLSGPSSNQFSQILSIYGGAFLDVLDFHHYGDEASDHQRRIDEAQRIAADHPHCSLAISEFNLRAGPTPFEKMLFVMPAALAQAQVLFTAIQAGSEHTPLDYLALYLFAGPSTHRSFKHLVYGDLNMLSWDGKDTALRAKGDEWYPTFDELQLRHTTPAYHIFKALARAFVDDDAQSSEIVATSVPQQYQVLACRRNADLFLHIINPLDADALAAIADHQVDPAATHFSDVSKQKPTMTINLPADHRRSWAIIRRTASGQNDHLVEVCPLHESTLTIPDVAQSFTQICLTTRDLSGTESLKIIEQTSTPGNLAAGLELHQTTRLRAIDQEGRDLSESCIQWHSSHPHVVSVGSSGLVQRLRRSDAKVVITATALPNGISASQSIGLATEL